MESRFEFQDFLKVFLLSLVLFAFFTAIFAFVPSVSEVFDGMHPTVSFVAQYLLQFVILFFPLWFFVVDKYSASFRDFGFQKIPVKKLLSTVALLYFLYLFLAWVIAALMTTSSLAVPGYEAQESYIPLFGTDLLGFTVAMFFISIVAPFLEELFFRGFIYRVFTKTWPVWLGSILTATLFALIHFQINSFFPLLILGLILNYAYQRTGSVWTSVVFHSLNNTIAFSLDIYLYFHPELLEKLQTVTGFLL